MVKVTLKDGTIVEGTSEEIYALDLFVETDEVVSVEVEEVAPLTVGDYARVVEGANVGILAVGDLVKIRDIGTIYDFVVDRVSDGEGEAFDHLDLVRATDEEVASAKAQAEVDAIFTANGRKVNELRKGDLVRVIDNCGAYAFGNGSIVEVSRDSITLSANVGNGWLVVADIVTFVENRLDLN